MINTAPVVFPLAVSSCDSLPARPVLIHYDPRADRDFAPFRVDQYLVYRTRIRGTPHTRYTVATGEGRVLGHQISYPSADNCTSLERNQREEQRTTQLLQKVATVTVDSASLTDRMVAVLALQKMSLGTLSATVNVGAETLSPILTRLWRDKRVTRTGKPGAFIYSAA